ncbi:hypothetical protein ACFSSA_13540 [Luteolibacter algae]|uniref:Uncharacterized protein n=1 Tax=Luteolibacter algae TaxID=454151 RepID=A0ABW5DCF7_9BACT
MTKLNHRFNREAERKKEDEWFLWIMFLLILLESQQVVETPSPAFGPLKPKWAFG